MHRRSVLAITLALGLTSFAGAASAQSGPLVIYTSTPTEQMDQLVARFNESYPDVTVEYFRSGTTEVINRLQAEFTAGGAQADVLLIADTVVMTQLKADDRLQAYPDAPIAGTDASLHDSDMTYFST
ncbi:MAG TPA: extracellular solute-binding protein, partial [Saliniramus sp.]|nr:extracellular solute-binding protein [Saliniramus sp.]